jgi:hypothetical protein
MDKHPRHLAAATFETNREYSPGDDSLLQAQGSISGINGPRKASRNLPPFLCYPVQFLYAQKACSQCCGKCCAQFGCEPSFGGQVRP